jgi:hypothetical protein
MKVSRKGARESEFEIFSAVLGISLPLAEAADKIV